MEFQSKADLLYEEVREYQQNIEQIMENKDATQADIVAACDFQKENLKEGIQNCYMTMENYNHAAEQIDAQISVLKERMDTLKSRKNNFETKANTLSEVIKTAMVTMGEQRIFLPLVTIEAKGTEQVVVDDPEAVPDELRNKVKVPEPSKTLLKKYLAENPECEFAHMEKCISLVFQQ